MRCPEWHDRHQTCTVHLSPLLLSPPCQTQPRAAPSTPSPATTLGLVACRGQGTRVRTAAVYPMDKDKKP